MPLIAHPWLLVQPRLRTVDDQLRVCIEILWEPAGPPELQIAVVCDDPQVDELLSLRVSSPLRSIDLGPALREIGGEVANLYRRSLNPFDDLT